MNKSSIVVESKRESEAPVELENQFILRLPAEPAAALREALQSGSTSVKDRLNIKLEPDLRHGQVRFDHWLLHARLYDLPTISETWKTIDRKSFYKTADVCQLLICKLEDDHLTDEESPSKSSGNQRRKGDHPTKVDKKYLWPHGLAPPLKNVRRRRFRKTLKKKVVEAPEIEKEVKRLLRSDNEAVHVRWEVISEEEDRLIQQTLDAVDGGGGTGGDDDGNEDDGGGIIRPVDVGEHDIFGEVLSDVDSDENEDDDMMPNMINVDEDYDEDRLSADDSRNSGDFLVGTTSSAQQPQPRRRSSGSGGSRRSSATANDNNSQLAKDRELVTQFCREMFYPLPQPGSISGPGLIPNASAVAALGASSAAEHISTTISREEMMARLETLRHELSELSDRRQQQEAELMVIENQALRQRLHDMLQSLTETQMDKEREYKDLLSLLSDIDQS